MKGNLNFDDRQLIKTVFSFLNILFFNFQLSLHLPHFVLASLPSRVVNTTMEMVVQLVLQKKWAVNGATTGIPLDIGCVKPKMLQQQK
jgi:hypothetical protein